MSEATSVHYDDDEDDYNHDRCSCLYRFLFLFILLLLLVIFIIAGISCTVFYNLYHPHGPTFSLDSLNVTSLNKDISFDVTCINPNGKIKFLYDPFVVTLRSKSSTLGHGTYPTFTSNAKNVRAMKIDAFMSEKLRDDLTLVLEGEVRVKIGRIVSKGIGIRVTCSKIHGIVRKGVHQLGKKCKVDFRTRFWNFTF